MAKVKMVEVDDLGPLLGCALGDSYGAGFEFVPDAKVRARNNLSGYLQHQKWKALKPGLYTDDTQMSMGLVEHILANDPWRLPVLADRWVKTFKRDPHAGYSGGFYQLLKEVNSGMQLMARIRPDSDKNGGAMRAWPCGLMDDTRTVRDLAMRQAALTHCTAAGMAAATAAALMFHHRYYNIGPLPTLPYFIDQWVPGFGLGEPAWKGHVSTSGIHTVKAAMTALVQGDTLADVVQRAVAFGGDTDTVAAIAATSAAVCSETRNVYPKVLLDRLENGPYGHDYIRDLDAKILANFPRPAADPTPASGSEGTDDGGDWFDRLFGED